MACTAESKKQSADYNKLHGIGNNSSEHESLGAPAGHVDEPIIMVKEEKPSDFVICRCAYRRFGRVVLGPRDLILITVILLKQWLTTDEEAYIGLENNPQSRCLWR